MYVLENVQDSHDTDQGTDTQTKVEPSFKEEPVYINSDESNDQLAINIASIRSLAESDVQKPKSAAVFDLPSYSPVDEIGLLTKPVECRCYICGRIENNAALLKFHLSQIHGQTDGILINVPVLKCPFCTERFSTKKNRNEHLLMIHLKDKYKELRCNVCNKRFSSVSNRNQHILKFHANLRE